MVTDQQVRRLRKFYQTKGRLAVAAAKAGMSERTARCHLRSRELPSEARLRTRHWRTRPDPFVEVWPEVTELLDRNSGLQAVTILDYLQRKEAGRFQDGQLRTLQRRIKVWRATEGPAREVFFAQKHEPGELCQSDFTHLNSLEITIAGARFDHMVHHFVLTYSNWEAATICFSESFESLSEGLQNALWELGGVPRIHRTDRLSTAVHKVDHPEIFTRRYQGLLRHHGLEGQRIQARAPHENGDVEQAHHRFKQALEQALMLRGSRDFASRDAYAAFMYGVIKQCNAGRRERFEEELPLLRSLPARRLDTRQKLRVRVGQGSTLRAAKNVYSVHSRMIGEHVEVRLGPEDLEIWYGQRKVDQFPRLRGEGKHRINYRHIIDWLVRKPGAFENYRYRDDLFPSSVFRITYDLLKASAPQRASREYLKILHVAAQESESRVEASLRRRIASDEPLRAKSVADELAATSQLPPVTEIEIPAVDLMGYDALLVEKEAACPVGVS
jgi:hypothetical protein